LKIDIFVPPQFDKAPLDIDWLNRSLGKNMHFASQGRHALFHILKALDVKGKVLVPAFICESILDPLRKLGISPVYYDLETTDLNASIESIRFLSTQNNITALLVASMYGNAANITAIERFCFEKGIILIDDAAQSFGATLDGRIIGTFGNAGFFSFSPGKPTSGHMGAFFWTDRDNYSFNKTNHCITHWATYLDFYFNRLNRYRYNKRLIFGIFTKLKNLFMRFNDITYDGICDFEVKILGGILQSLNKGNFNFRNDWAASFEKKFENNKYFRVIKSLRGKPSHHKIVILCKDKDTTDRLKDYLINSDIFCLAGYNPLTYDMTNLPNTKSVIGRILELPIENDNSKMNYLIDTVAAFKT